MSSQIKLVELSPIIGKPSEWDDIEEVIKELFRRKIYLPLLRELKEPARMLNAKKNALYAALYSGRVTFYRGTFSGKFNAEITRELKRLGARWDKKSGAFKAQLTSLPIETRNVISSTASKFQEKIDRIDRILAQDLPEEIAGALKLSDKFDRTIWKTDKEFKARVEGLAVASRLTDSDRKKIADEWENNLKLYVKDFTKKQTLKLREEIKTSVFAGNRYGSVVEKIQKSFNVSANKAKFLARQETKLLVAKFQETRYADAGITEYTWHSVVGSPKHPVRPRHKKLADASKAGKIYKWNDPPITSEPGQPVRRNNPGQDYNCRCFAKPVVRFKRDSADSDKDKPRR